MNLTELIFREINLVIVHTGVIVPAISLDRIRMARPTANLIVNQSGGMLVVTYPEERAALQFDGQRITATDTANRTPEQSPVIELALAQLEAIGSPRAVAFGYNYRFDFQVEGMEVPSRSLSGGLLRDVETVAKVLRTDAFETGVGFTYRRGVKLWTIRLDPMPGALQRLLVHANVHEDIMTPQPPGQPLTSTEDPPPPAWLASATEPALPSLESMRSDLGLQCRAALDTVVGLLQLSS